VGVERRRDVLPHEGGLQGLRRLRVVPLTGLHDHLALREREPDRGVALGDECDAPGGLDDLPRPCDGVGGGHIGEQAADGRVVTLDQLRGGAPARRLEADDLLAPLGLQRQLDGPGLGHRLGDVGEGARPHERDLRDVGVGRRPADLLHGEPVAVGGEERDSFPLDLHAHTREERERLVPAGGSGHLEDSLIEGTGVDGAGEGGELREGRIVVHRHGVQREPRRATRQDHLGAVEFQVDRPGRQRLRYVGQDLSLDDGYARDRHGGRHLAPGRDLVVEAGDREGAAVAGLQQHAGEDRDRGARRQRSGRPGHGFGQHITVYSELHDGTSISSAGRRRLDCSKNVMDHVTVSCGRGQSRCTVPPAVVLPHVGGSCSCA